MGLGRTVFRSWWSGLAAALLAAVVMPGLAAAQTVASTRIGTASLLSPEAANNYYPAGVTHTNGIGLAQRPDEIRELV